MKKGIYNFLKGKFLVSDEAVEHWKFIVTCTVLAIIMIASSHSAERKVHRISEMGKEVRELRSEFVDARTSLMNLRLESTIVKKMEPLGIAPAEKPAYKIIVGSGQSQ